KHGDRWLQDMMSAKQSDGMTAGLAALAEAVNANLSDESDRALEKAQEAAARVRATRSTPGELRAQFEWAYALRSVRSASDCVQKAVALEGTAERMQYRWIHGQAILERGNCHSVLGDFGAAHRHMERALAFVRGAGYRDLELRAAGILASAQTQSGNL